MGPHIPLGVLTDLIGYTLDIIPAEKQILLGEVNVQRRAELLLGHLAAAAEEFAVGPAGERFPPVFSAN